jgi:thiosulfate reductase cytochrome b subunit
LDLKLEKELNYPLLAVFWSVAVAAHARILRRAMSQHEVIYRHSGTVRITHWINVLVLLVLLMSGMQIFNAHPALYLGAQSNFDAPIFAMDAMQDGDTVKGVTTVFGHSFDTDGVLGASTDSEGNVDERGFPWSVTLPGHRDLSMGRRWHFFFAWLFLFNGLAYLLWSLGSGHLRRDLAPSGKDLSHIGASILEHAQLKFPKGEEAKRYNVLQKLSYLIVALILLPLMLLTGLAMSPDSSGASRTGSSSPWHLGLSLSRSSFLFSRWAGGSVSLHHRRCFSST